MNSGARDSDRCTSHCTSIVPHSHVCIYKLLGRQVRSLCSVQLEHSIKSPMSATLFGNGGKAKCTPCQTYISIELIWRKENKILFFKIEKGLRLVEYTQIHWYLFQISRSAVEFRHRTQVRMCRSFIATNTDLPWNIFDKMNNK